MRSMMTVTMMIVMANQHIPTSQNPTMVLTVPITVEDLSPADSHHCDLHHIDDKRQDPQP